MKAYYQLVIIGNEEKYRTHVCDTFATRTDELGLDKEAFKILSEANFYAEYKPSNPTACLYLCNGGLHTSLDILEILIEDAAFILPVVPDIEKFENLVPNQLIPINGFELRDGKDVEAVAARAMEALSLLRNSRRLFISYRRIESRSIAIQLYEYLDQKGFDVFLDTHSIRPGEIFQDELWHRLVDTDVVILLDTPGFLESKWTEKELAKASAMSIGMLQLIWPNHNQIPYSTFCHPYFLNEADFEGEKYTGLSSTLKMGSLHSIGSNVESLRARSLASRQDNLIQEFTATAKEMKLPVNLQPEKFITLKMKNGKDIALIPTVGVPQAFTYHQTEELIKRIREQDLPEIFLLFDHRNIIERWQKHLKWLDLYLPIKSVKITEIESWMNKI
jgi:hypothetical protein